MTQVETDPDSSQNHDFGTYALTGVSGRLLKRAQTRPPTWWGRRMALLLRKVVLKTQRPVQHPVQIDAHLDGLNIRFHMGDNVSERKYLFTPQFFDVFERQCIAEHLPPDGVFIDIGANAGLYTLTAAKHLSKSGRVLAIEPNPKVSKRLESNIGFNDFSCQIDILPYGVADENKTADLYLDPTNLGGSSLLQTRQEDHQNGQSLTIEIRTLSDLLAEQNVHAIDILKIDIEGAEEKALRPFFKTAPRSLWPRHMIIENDPAQWESGLIDWLTDDTRGYDLIKTTRMNIVLRAMVD